MVSMASSTEVVGADGDGLGPVDEVEAVTRRRQGTSIW
jgi:hypothetical protein